MQFIFSIINLCLFFLLALFLAKLVTNLDLKSLMGELKTNGLQDSEFKNYLVAYLEALNTLNINSLSKFSTDLFYHSQENFIRLLSKLGLKRKIFVNFGDNISKTTDMNTIGKVSWMVQNIACDYNEQLIDSVTGKILEEKKYPNTKYNLSLNKNPFRQYSNPTYCTGCGSVLNTSGEICICPNCGRTYHSDSTEWVINKVYPDLPPLQNPITLIAGLFGTLILIIPIISFFSLFISILHTVSVFLNVLTFLCIIAYCIYAIWYYYALLKLQNMDKLCSMFHVMNRIEFLIYQYISCLENNSALMKQFMDNEFYKYWSSTKPTNSHFHIIDYRTSNVCTCSEFNVLNGRQHLKIKLPLTLSVFDDQSRQLIKVKRTLNMVIFRNQNVRYQNKHNSECFTCKGCGMSVNMTTEGKCKFCGTEYELADFDWIIEQMDNGLYV